MKKEQKQKTNQQTRSIGMLAWTLIICVFITIVKAITDVHQATMLAASLALAYSSWTVIKDMGKEQQ